MRAASRTVVAGLAVLLVVGGSAPVLWGEPPRLLRDSPVGSDVAPVAVFPRQEFATGRPSEELEKSRERFFRRVNGHGPTAVYSIDLDRLIREMRPILILRNVGADVRPNPEATGEMLDLQRRFAAALSELNLVPESRRSHFAWLEHNECFQRGLAHQIGWHGDVQSAEPTSDGGWIVNVRVGPRVYGGFRSPIMDHVTETYEYRGDTLRFLYSDAAVQDFRRQGYPVVL